MLTQNTFSCNKVVFVEWSRAKTNCKSPEVLQTLEHYSVHYNRAINEWLGKYTTSYTHRPAFS